VGTRDFFGGKEQFLGGEAAAYISMHIVEW